MATTEKCADDREHLYLCSTCGKHGPEDVEVERLTGERDRLQSAFDTQQGWLNECQAELKRRSHD